MVKTITIRNEVYEKLQNIKAKNESFSELFDRLIQYTAPAETLNKLRAKVEFTDKEAMLQELQLKRTEKRT